jgi:hypothetical protein
MLMQGRPHTERGVYGEYVEAVNPEEGPVSATAGEVTEIHVEAITTEPMTAKMRIRRHIGKEVFAISLADPDADGTQPPRQPGRCPNAAAKRHATSWTTPSKLQR